MKRPRLPDKNELVSLGILCALAAAACTLVLLIPPGGKYAGWLPKCLFHKMTGLYCPGCGGTRALSSLLHGDLRSSLHNNLLLIPGSLTAAVLIMKPGISLRRPVAVAIVVIIVAFTVLRNIPCAPFTLLAPVPLP